MTTKNPKPPPATSASRDWGQLFKLHSRIKPPEGWRPVAAEGFRIAEMADRVDLVRLRDVVDWLALGDTRDTVLRRCLGRLVDADLYPLCMFYVLDPDSEPVRVLDRFHASMAAATALGLPGVYPTSEPVEVAAWLLEAWWRAWPGHNDISHAVDRAEIIQRRREKGRRLRLQALGLTESDVGDEPAYWPADDVLLASLNRLALPVFVAFDLWGYGVDTAAPAAGVEVAAATSASNVVPIRETVPAVDVVGTSADALPELPTTWAELVQYHKTNPGHLWTVELKRIVATERGRRGAQPGAAVAMGAELGFKGAERVNSLVRTKDQHGKRKAIEHQRTGTR